MTSVLTYQVIRKPRKRSVTIRISKTNEITVTAPVLFPDQKLDEIVKGHHQWILKRFQLNEELRKKFPEKKYEAGELLSYLGRRIALEILQGEKRSVVLEGETLKIFIASEEEAPADLIKEIIQAWYESETEVLVKERVGYFQTRMGLQSSVIEIETLNSFWGRCQRSGKLKFNSKLLMAPPEVLDYVVVHELCHMIHPNHSPRFWREVETILPDYKAHRRWLTEHGQHLSF